MKKNKSDISKWVPTDNIPPKLYLESLSDDYDGLIIELKGHLGDAEKIVKLKFDSYYTYRNTNESYRLKMLNDYPIICEDWTLFFSERSDFINWLQEESQGAYSNERMIHYIIASPEDIVEVISVEPPDVETQ